MDTINSDKVNEVVNKIRSLAVEEFLGKQNNIDNKKMFEEAIRKELENRYESDGVKFKYEWDGEDLKVTPYIETRTIRLKV